MMKKKVFFLGGRDLEMQTIKALLDSKNIEYVDHDLAWADAELLSYNDDLLAYPEEEYDIYGIELRRDNDFLVPSNYHEIDHHGDMDFMPSSLEQVAKLLGHEMSLDERLVAANDRGYIVAMKELLADMKDPEIAAMSQESKAEKIREVRMRDRMAQGVTPEDEAIAEKEIQAGPCFANDRVLIYRTSLQHFSPLTDRVELKDHERLVLYNDTKLVIYGMRARIAGIAVENYARRFGKSLGAYSGGGARGFWGIPEDRLTKEEILEVAEFIKTMHVEYSGHIFYFPFQWKDSRENGQLSSSLENLKFKLEQWRKSDPDETDEEVLYNERNYFYRYVHKTLYDNGARDSMIRHFELSVGKKARYEIAVRHFTGDIKYSLRVDSVNLNLYSTGVGMLAFYLTNDTNTCVSMVDGKPQIRAMNRDDILRINQYGRRVMPPFFKDKESRDQLAKEIAIVGLEGFGELREDFNGYGLKDSWKPASFIRELIQSLSPQLSFEPVIDDRMFVMAWYKDDEMYRSVTADTQKWDHCHNGHFWYRYVFVDGGGLTCNDADMRAMHLDQSTYRRWMDMGSLYGVTRHSMVFLTTDTAPDFLFVTFQTIYARMVELVLMQRASLLSFSEMVTEVSGMLESGSPYEATRTLYRKYITFVNKFYHRDVTAQEQGVEIYQMLQKSLDMDESVKDLDNDIGELYQYISMVDDRDQSRKADLLNWIMGIFAPASFIVGIWGMNAMCEVVSDEHFWPQILTVVSFTVFVVAIYIIAKFIKKNNK